MSPRRGPALYELIRDKPRVRVQAGSSPAESPRPEPVLEPAPAVGGSMFAGAGRSIRVPMGYVFLAVAVGIALLFIGYFVGHSRAAAEFRAERRAQSADLLTEPVTDPLAERGGQLPDPGIRQAPGNSRPTGGARPAGQASAVVGSDPRVSGLNYFICARLREEEAIRAAEFLSANGVAAAVTPADNARLRLVIASRGFTRDEIRGAEATALRARITSLGRIFKDQHKGPTNFHDVYPEKYQP